MDDKINFEFIVGLKDQDRMIDWCMEVGLIGNTYICPRCNNRMKINRRTDISDMYMWRCKKGHDVKRSMRKGSWFDESKLSMYDVLMVTYMWCLGLSNNAIMCDLGVASATVVDWKNFCRDVCIDACIRGNDILGGDGVIVEIEENRIEQLKYQHGKRIEGAWVFGGLEKETKKCFMCVVPERNRNVLLEVIKENVRPGTIIISDCWKSYNCLEDERYRHLTVKYRYHFKNRDTNSKEGIWAEIKKKVGSSHCDDKFDSFLFEYLWRRRNQDSKAKLINIFLQAVREIYPPITHD